MTRLPLLIDVTDCTTGEDDVGRACPALHIDTENPASCGIGQVGIIHWDNDFGGYPAPDWCPLRHGDVTIRLREEKV